MTLSEFEKLVVYCAQHFVSNKSTVRATSAFTGVPKSSVHKYLTKNLPDINPQLYARARKILNYNAEVKHIRGGISTQRKQRSSMRV